MPGFVKTPHDEKKWSEAKQASGKETDKDSKGYWKLANFIFHKMKKSQGIEKAEEFMNSLVKSDPLSSIAGDRAKRAETYKQRGDTQNLKIAQSGMKDSHKERVQSIKEMPKPNLPKSEDMGKAENSPKILSPKPTPTSVANPMKSGEQSTISKTPKAPGMFKSEDFKDVKHASAQKLRDFMAKCKGPK
jgi:hypothetical protein